MNHFSHSLSHTSLSPEPSPTRLTPLTHSQRGFETGSILTVDPEEAKVRGGRGGRGRYSESLWTVSGRSERQSNREQGGRDQIGFER